MRTSRAVALAGTLLVLGAVEAGSQSRTSRAQQELGDALFRETVFANPGADFAASCDSCHRVGPDQRGAGRGGATGDAPAQAPPERFYSDGSPRSLLPGRGTVVQETTLRNTPTLLDLDHATRFGLDGRYASLDELLREKLVSAHLGWKEADRERAVANLHHVLLDDQETDYRALFQAAYRVDVETLDEPQAHDWVARALTDRIHDIVSQRTSRWDAFADINRIPAAPSAGEPPKHYGGRIHGRIGNQEGRVLIKRPRGFSQAAYEGFKTFFRTEGSASVGNCVACHVPPAFTDFGFHDVGVSQMEHESVHGKGSFAGVAIPGPEAKRPQASFLAVPSKEDPQRVDLGYWNWIDLPGAPERMPEESDTDLLRRMAGAFRTPSLRNLPRTGPYLHNGAYPTIEDAVRAKLEAARRAQSGELSDLDPELATMRLGEEDVKPLAEFLKALDEVGEDEFRELLLHFEEE